METSSLSGAGTPWPHRASPRFTHPPRSPRPTHPPSDRASGDLDPLLLKQHGELIPAPAGMLLPQRQDPLDNPQRCLRVSDRMRPPRFLLQGGQVIRVETSLPTVKSLSRDAKKPARPPSIYPPV